MNDVSTAMATLLHHLHDATQHVERVYVDDWLDHELTLPGMDPGDVVVRGGWPWYDPDRSSIRFHGMSVTLPHPYDEANSSSELYVYLELLADDDGFTVIAGIEANLEIDVYDLPAGRHRLLHHSEQEQTVDATVAAIGRCRDALVREGDLFSRIGFPRRQR